MSAPLQVLVVVVALVVSAGGGWLATRGVLRLADRSADADGGGTDGPDGPRARAALRGGTWIGLLERLAVTGCVLAGQPGGVAVVVAVKGLGRYPELRENPGASERFVIGTLTSLLCAGAVGLGGRWLLGV
ncbi:hypothetical protein [Cellulomonas hominis]